MARELRRRIWDFAVERDGLYATGIASHHVRWLIGKGYVWHAVELTLPGQRRRVFCHHNGLGQTERSCFVLTPQGEAFAQICAKQADHLAWPPTLASRRNGKVKPLAAVPTWDRDRQVLRLGAVIVKHFKLPAPNQETVLSAFEEESWPPRIDDPLTPLPDHDAKNRLHETVTSLNRNQKNRLIRFMGDGSGQGVCWELVEQSPSNHNGR